MQLKKLERGSKDLSIEMRIRPVTKNAILFYIGQNDDGRGDFVSLSLRDGFVEFRLLSIFVFFSYLL